MLSVFILIQRSSLISNIDMLKWSSLLTHIESRHCLYFHCIFLAFFCTWRVLIYQLSVIPTIHQSLLTDPSEAQKPSWHRGVAIQKVFAGGPGKFLRVQKVFAHNPWNCTGKFPDGLESFLVIWKVSGWSGKFPDNLENFLIVWKVSGRSGKFQDNLEDFQITWKVSGWSLTFPDSLESVWVVWEVSG